MITRINQLFDEAIDRQYKAIILKGSTEQFCAGGDLKVLMQDILQKKDYTACYDFFEKEFQLDYKVCLCCNLSRSF